MASSGPIQVLGAIGAMQTLVENFPMSILDLTNGPTYTSVFMFLMDVLKMCGIPLQRLAEYLIEEIFGYSTNLNLSPRTIYDSLDRVEYDEQSEFLKELEISIKGILMAIITGIFSCSAIPLLPNEYIDKCKNAEWFNDMGYKTKCGEGGGKKGMLIPTQLLDYFGYFNVSPISKAGKMFYNIPGGDKYYKKTDISTLIEVPDGTTTINIPTCSKFIQLYIVFGEGHTDWVSRSYAGADEYVFMLSEPLDFDLHITLSATDFHGKQTSVDLTIKKGYTDSEIYFMLPDSPNGNTVVNEIYSVSLSRDGSTPQKSRMVIGDNDDTFLYLDRNLSKDVIDYWDSVGNPSSQNIDWLTAADGPTEPEEIDVTRTEFLEKYTYAQTDDEIVDAVRVNDLPIDATIADPEYIVHYEGLTPNTLYKTEDMNAFLWYIIHRSGTVPQSEMNKNMWDSRYSERMSRDDKQGSRLTPEDWNYWYNFKKNTTQDDTEFPATDTLYPILQFQQHDLNMYVQFPAQRYFKPTVDNSTSRTNILLAPNASIYRFSWEYLENIRIFNPRSILFGMIDALLNGMLSVAAGVKMTVSMRETSARLSSAIKKYIEAEDTEVSDCYASFSNEEFDAMLEDMILSRYGATKNGGEVNRAQTHDIENYLSNLDSVNFSSSMGGETAKITRLIEDISVSDSTEGSIDYGVNLEFNDSFWKQLLWAIALPIIKSLLSPQVILLFIINFQIMGLLPYDGILNGDQTAIIKIIFTKIFVLIRTIISFIKDKLIELTWRFIEREIMPMLLKYRLLEISEQLDNFLMLLTAALACLPKFRLKSPISGIDDIDYADITDEQTAPENTTNC